MELNSGLGLAVRWIHLAAAILVVGAFSATIIAGRPPRPTAIAWERRVLGWGRGLLVLAVVSGLGVLAYQTAVVEGRAEAAGEPGALLKLLLETTGGHVWLARHGLLLLLAVFVAFRVDTMARADWIAARGEAALLALCALGLLGASGHAAAVEPGTSLAIGVDAVHLLTAGVWIGGLLPIAGLLAAASHEAGADARPWAVLAARRFSRIALVVVLALVASGIWNAIIQVQSVAGLVGTPYGRLLLVKLAIFVPILGLAAVNRRWLLPALSGEASTVGRPAMRRLARLMRIEALLGLAVVGVVAALVLTPPALHVEVTWPFTFRLSLGALDAAPELRPRALVGSQLVVLGLAAAAATLTLRSRRLPLLALGLTLGAAGVGLAAPTLAIDAYPTTYLRPAVTYHVGSIAEGAWLYREHCAACHGPAGAGDGPAGRGLPRPPADLRSGHTGQHTAGDLFWWITNGIAAAGMPGFDDRLTEEQRWDLVNLVRMFGAAFQARLLGPMVDSGRRAIVAPDFAFAVGPMPSRTLRDYRGRRIVLLVLYALPASRQRLAQLAGNYAGLAILGVEVIAVPRDAAPDAIRRLGPKPPVLFPVVTEGAREIVAVYDLLAGPPHAEFLIDRQGYLRARWAPVGGVERDLNLLLAEIQRLNEERPALPPADEHVH